MTCATAPVFWAPQQRLPIPLQRFVRVRLEAALEQPKDRALLIWPTVLGAPRLRETHPGGVGEAELLQQAGRMLAALGITDPEAVWRETLNAYPDTADRGPDGWLPQRIWEPLAPQISLRCGVILLALTGQPEDDPYRLASGVTLFNSALFHECHDALEGLWTVASGDLKKGLQGLILLAAGFYHQQRQDVGGMMSLWRDGLKALASFEGEVPTPWGRVDIAECVDNVEQRLQWLRSLDSEAPVDGLWDLPRPEWTLK
ncbi:MAG: DUF309 domain-containing protein [Holophaga sp.]